MNNYERGFQSPKIETQNKLSDLFGIPTAYIMGVNKTDGDMVSIYDELLAIKKRVEAIEEMLR